VLLVRGDILLQVIDKYDNKYRAYEIDNVDNVKALVNNNELICPECRNPVQFKAGPTKIWHFAHKPNTECTYPYWEPESEQHLKGKLVLKEWLEKLYPNSQVELEYKVDATNQRSDIMVIHSDGSFEAYEFQCSPISDTIMSERHNLYKSAGIKDTWIFGDTVHRNHTSWEFKDEELHKFRGMEFVIYEYQKATYYLNPFECKLRALFDLEEELRYSKTVLVIFESIFNIYDCFWHKGYLFDEEYRNNYEKAQAAKIRAAKKAERKKQEEIKAQEINKQKRLNKKRERLLELKNDVQTLKSNLTDKEYQLFKELCHKHQLNIYNMPGIFHVNVEGAEFIITPTYVWQLWIYDKFIYDKKTWDYDKVYVPKVYKEFKKLVSYGVFRVKLNDRREHGHYSFAIYSYIDLMYSVGILQKLSFKDNSYYQVKMDKVPVYEDKEKNILLCIALEDSIYRSEIGICHQTYNSFLEDLKTLYDERQSKKAQSLPEVSSPPINEQRKHSKIIQYIHFLSLENENLFNSVESDFIADLYRKRRSLTNNEKEIIMGFLQRLEKRFNISLELIGK
jgi:competence protein CoiA